MEIKNVSDAGLIRMSICKNSILFNYNSC